MPSRQVLEGQLKRADEVLAAWKKHLTTSGVKEESQVLDSKYRSLAAKTKQIRMRLRAVSAVEAVNAEVEARKATGAAAE
jgi:hypothetical protein